MSAGFTRRYAADPGIPELTKIEGIVIIDNTAPSSVVGGPSGVACCIGEFENGPFVPYEATSSGDFTKTFGKFGYTYAGVVASNPCARARKADGAVNPEFWNGNGFIATAQKRFQRLVIVRVDTSVGQVQFSNQASISGSSAFNFPLVTGQIVSLIVNGAGAVSATFTGTPAQRVSAAGTYPSTFAGGETITFAIDGIQYVATFQAGDQTQNQVIARMNAAAGGTPFVNVGGSVTDLNGRIGGTSGSVQIIAVSGVLVTTATGFSAGAAATGGGNVGNIAQVTVAEANTIISAATTAAVTVDRDANNLIRANNVGTPLTGTLQIGPLTTATGFGFPLSVTSNAATVPIGIIPAGTQVKTTGAVVYVTTQDVQTVSGNAGPYSVKVRHGLDDGTGTSNLTGTITAFVSPVLLGSFSVTNALPTTNALTEAQLDVAYMTAFDQTLSTNGVTKLINQIFSARRSNALSSYGKQNAILASANGCNGRQFFHGPPLGTTRVNAESTTVQPGVGTYRDERTVYCYPGANVLIPDMTVRGTAGGAGFTATGQIDVHYDSFVAATCSQLNPEEDPGQITGYQAGILSVEVGNPDVQPPALSIGDYVVFKSLGIAGLRIDDGDVITESGITSVDPTVNPSQSTINRRRLADFCQDSLAKPLQPYIKKLQSKQKQIEVYGIVDGFLASLLNGPPQRIAAYSIDAKSGNSLIQLQNNIFRLVIKITQLSTFGTIVLDLTLGTTVVVTPIG